MIYLEISNEDTEKLKKRLQGYKNALNKTNRREAEKNDRTKSFCQKRGRKN